jgi:hypothetical protein
MEVTNQTQKQKGSIKKVERNREREGTDIRRKGRTGRNRETTEKTGTEGEVINCLGGIRFRGHVSIHVPRECNPEVSPLAHLFEICRTKLRNYTAGRKRRSLDQVVCVCVCVEPPEYET